MPSAGPHPQGTKAVTAGRQAKELAPPGRQRLVKGDRLLRHNQWETRSTTSQKGNQRCRETQRTVEEREPGALGFGVGRKNAQNKKEKYIPNQR